MLPHLPPRHAVLAGFFMRLTPGLGAHLHPPGDFIGAILDYVIPAEGTQSAPAVLHPQLAFACSPFLGPNCGTWFRSGYNCSPKWRFLVEHG